MNSRENVWRNVLLVARTEKIVIILFCCNGYPVSASNSFFHRYGLCLLRIILTCSCSRSFSFFFSLICSLVHSFAFSSSLFSVYFIFDALCYFFYHDQVFINHKVKTGCLFVQSCFSASSGIRYTSASVV